ncbi:hypothetical protein [Burkholderia sp. BE17]|uniref:hypothetical protein n=1 Tax=Burkholderia sp. BE17 TaxID=2656644 RepID=UPI00128BF08D|nr:hypothetical protein [Burkholderia sp. BE17]MPV71573.1 hypothetical protein [Burkholderia sp. BE17]
MNLDRRLIPPQPIDLGDTRVNARQAQGIARCRGKRIPDSTMSSIDVPTGMSNAASDIGAIVIEAGGCSSCRFRACSHCCSMIVLNGSGA